jgi:hypothetical protein
MSALTKKERDGLEEVFLSIHANDDKYQKIKELSTLLFERSGTFSMQALVKHAKQGLKETNISHFLAFLDKKKKFLSK